MSKSIKTVIKRKLYNVAWTYRRFVPHQIICWLKYWTPLTEKQYQSLRRQGHMANAEFYNEWGDTVLTCHNTITGKKYLEILNVESASIRVKNI